MKAIILARVSSREQEEGHSIPAQLARARDYVDRKGFEIEEEITIIETASTNKIRAEFNKIVIRIKQSSEEFALIVDTVDRITRNFRDSVILDDLRKEEKVQLHFIREGLVVNKDSNSSEILRWDMAVMFAKSYILQLSDNVKRSIEQKLRSGEWPGKAPIGYLNATKDNGDKDVILDPERAPLIRKAFELYATGHYSFFTLRKKLKEEGLTNNTPNKGILSQGQLDFILKGRFYYGYMEMKGKLYPHKYPPIISKPLFDKVQEVKASWHKKPFKWASKPYIYRGLIICSECGCTITPEMSKGKYVYYHCTNYHKKHAKSEVEWLREEELTSQFKELLLAFRIPNKVLKWLVDNLNRSHEDEKQYHESVMTNLEREYSKLQTKLVTLYDDRLDQRITIEMYDKKVQEIKDKQEDILEQRKLHSKADKGFYIMASKILELANKSAELFESSEREQKRQLLQFVLQNCQLRGKNIDFTLKKPFDAILLANKNQDWLRR